MVETVNVTAKERVLLERCQGFLSKVEAMQHEDAHNTTMSDTSHKQLDFTTTVGKTDYLQQLFSPRTDLLTRCLFLKSFLNQEYGEICRFYYHHLAISSCVL
ncbi:hypothetical protein YC2023_060154 [Brassica napus]